MRKVWLMTTVFTLALALQVGLTSKGLAGESEPRHEKRIDAMAERLKLTDAQKKTVHSVMDEKREKMKTLHEEFMTKKKALDQDAETKISAVLDAKQKAAFAEMKEERMDRREDFKERRK